MSNDLERRLQEALDAGDVSDELLQELEGQPELEPMVELDAALRSMPSVDFDLSEGVLARLDEDLDEIPGLLDAPHFEQDASADLGAAPAAAAAAAAPAAAPAAPAPISLDDERRKRSAAPFLLSAAAVIGLVATGTMMTLSSSPDASMEMAAAEAPSPTSVGGRGGYAEEESAAVPAAAVARGAAEPAAEPAPEMPAELAELSDDMAPDEVMEPEAEADDSVVANLQYDEADQNQPRDMPAAAPRARMSARTSARGGMPATGDRMEQSEDQTLSASQRRTLARIESCLPDHIRITRVRESADGRRVVGVETSEPLSENVDECVSGVLDTFPRARRRRARQQSSMSAAAPTSRIDE